jgi:putative YphP/YqiW family bacilliredoxin
MREELTGLGVRELRTAAQVDEAVTKSLGTVMIVVNSVCGCAAGKARPGVALALRHRVKPDVVATVFAGADIDATDRARRPTGPWDASKTAPAFSDMLATLRRASWLERLSVPCTNVSTLRKLERPIVAYAAQHAAPASCMRSPRRRPRENPPPRPVPAPMTSAAPTAESANPPSFAGVSRSPTVVAKSAVNTGAIVGTMSAASDAGAMVSPTKTNAL